MRSLNKSVLFFEIGHSLTHHEEAEHSHHAHRFVESSSSVDLEIKISHPHGDHEHLELLGVKNFIRVDITAFQIIADLLQISFSYIASPHTLSLEARLLQIKDKAQTLIFLSKLPSSFRNSLLII